MSDLKVDGIIASTGTNTALTLQGKGSGKVDIGDGALSFPDADGSDGEFIKTDGSGALSFAAAGGHTLGTDIALASGTPTVVDFTVTGANFIVLSTSGWSTNGTSDKIVQIGDSGGIETANYDSSTNPGTFTAVNSTNGFNTEMNGSGDDGNCMFLLSLVDETTFDWTCMMMMHQGNSAINFGGGNKALSAAITTVRLTTTGGSDTFDAGIGNVIYW
jgi:hypothetical protein